MPQKGKRPYFDENENPKNTFRFFFQRMYGHLLREFCKDSTLACIILKIEAPSSFKNVMKTGNNGLFLRKSIYQGQSGIFKQFSTENDKIKCLKRKIGEAIK